MREDPQEDRIEAPQQFFFFFFQLDIINNESDIFELPFCDLLVEGAFESFQFDEKFGIQAEKVADIFFLDLIGLFQFVN